MRKKTRANLKTSWRYLLFLFCFGACLEPEEGCLDILATNFNAAADEECNNCCTFPELRLEFEHNMGDDALTLGQDYVTEDQQYFTLIDLRYFLSDVQITGPDLRLQFLDSFSVVVMENGGLVEKELENNMKLVRRTVTSEVFGRFINFGLIDTLRFTIGVNELLNTALPGDFPSTYPLNIESETMYWNPDSGYIFNLLSFKRDTFTASDTLNLSIGLDPRRVEVVLPYADTLARANNLSITLEVDYLEWFEGINFATDPEDLILEKIVNNTSKAFQIKD
jgi:hypothetical protein